jgi:hypothetical protein
MLLYMAYFDRGRAPVVMDLGPVLDPQDALGGKVSALATERDYIDVAAALRRHSPGQLIGFIRRLDPGLTDEYIAAAGRRLDRIDDETFAGYRLSPQDVTRLRQRFTAWTRT